MLVTRGAPGLQVAALQLQNLITIERLSASAEKNRELTAESQKTHLHNQQQIRCVGGATAKQAQGRNLKQLRHCIQIAEKLMDIPLLPIGQVLPPCGPFLASRMMYCFDLKKHAILIGQDSGYSEHIICCINHM
jgi:hypothetical protein